MGATEGNCADWNRCSDASSFAHDPHPGDLESNAIARRRVTLWDAAAMLSPMKSRLVLVVALLGLLCVPFAVRALEAHTTQSANLRAGPARDYPVVAVLPPYAPLDVQGCLSDYSWCDVIALDINERGWVYAGNIEYLYEGAEVPLLDYGSMSGIVVIPFVLGDYWDQHYRYRPWYHDRDRWIHTPRPVQPPRAGPPSTSQPAPPKEPQLPPPQPPAESRVPPPRSAQPGRPPTTSGDTQSGRK
jgi:uncharacterized protein YraI